MIAGPNGSGKTTNAKALVDFLKLDEFINADEIARGLAPLNPESVAIAASRLMILRFRELLNAKKSFAFETTAAARNFLKYLIQAKDQGYEFNLLFLWLPNPEQAIKRVAQRVLQNGHHVPEEYIRRRYYAGIKNLLKIYLPLADSALVLDNSSEAKKVIAIKNIKYPLEIKDKLIWEELQRVSNV